MPWSIKKSKDNVGRVAHRAWLKHWGIFQNVLVNGEVMCPLSKCSLFFVGI